MPVWPAQPPESTAYPFNREERARLTIYRAAIAAGFYSDTAEATRHAPSAPRLIVGRSRG
ncbi:MAG TPA: hypothetical protein VGL99_31310 [Chloroflexota bacterium]|jgi:hypothetical protein